MTHPVSHEVAKELVEALRRQPCRCGTKSDCTVRPAVTRKITCRRCAAIAKYDAEQDRAPAVVAAQGVTELLEVRTGNTPLGDTGDYEGYCYIGVVGSRRELFFAADGESSEAQAVAEKMVAAYNAATSAQQSDPQNDPAYEYAVDKAGSYAEAFFEIGRMLDIPAMAMSPKDVFTTIMKPKLLELIRSAKGVRT